ncbi:protein PYRICULARIA ORYZAE RESISTANCE 21-like [Vicia villosa]|uniref:protein PYRICULARIA ORYZAE RESISTANCE 21-like n=1 Tax=Vicia villosa TaxID=3911 RepID=UPI00273C07C7|nr:protein PYRICULARIA ORYZAE RESISTANCE 21-like [Vicia villosa]
MAEKVTFMKLKVDLECEKCYKKVKKLLGKYPQIRDQKYDEKGNMVAIMVVCCSPEKIRDKLCYKGGGSIKSIEIVDPPKPKPAEPEKKKEAEKPKAAAEPEKKKEGDKPKPAKEAEKPKAAEPEKKKDSDKPKDAEKPKAKPEGEKPKEKAEGEKPKDKPVAAASMQMIPQMPAPMAVPVGMCYVPSCYEGRPVVPYGSAYPQQYGGPGQYYDGYYARPVYDSYGGSGPCYVGRCDQYLSEENATGCSIM